MQLAGIWPGGFWVSQAWNESVQLFLSSVEGKKKRACSWLLPVGRGFIIHLHEDWLKHQLRLWVERLVPGCCFPGPFVEGWPTFPSHSGAQITWPLQSLIATSALELWVDGFAWFCMLYHHCMTDGPSSLDISLTLKSQKWHLAVAKNVAKSHRKRYKSQELNNANSYKLRSPKSVENWVSYSSPKFRGQMQKNGA